MKTFFVSVFLAAAFFAAGFGFYFLNTEKFRHKPQFDAGMAKFESRILETPSGKNYDATIKLENPQSSSLRVYIDVLNEENYIACEISQKSISVFRVEAGIKTCEISSFTGETSLQSGKLPQSIRIKRRAPVTDLICDGRRLVRFCADGFEGGHVGVGVMPGCEASNPVVQPVGNLVFADDFMRASANSGDWISKGEATWEVRSLDNPARSSNAFIYQGWGEKSGMSLIGREYWDSYKSEVSVLGSDEGTIGLVMAAAGGAEGKKPTRYCLIKWTALDSKPEAAEAGAAVTDKKDEAKPAQAEKTEDAKKDEKPKQAEAQPDEKSGKEIKAPAQIGELQIICVSPEGEKILARRKGGYRSGQWYRLGATVSDCKVTVLIDGNESLSASSEWFCGGKAGLFVKGKSPSEFDDYSLASLLENEGGEISATAWQFYGGNWKCENGELLGATKAASHAVAVTGKPTWRNVLVKAKAKNIASAPYGLVAAFRDPGDYVAYIIDPLLKKKRIVSVLAGKETVLDEAKLEGAPEKNLTMRVDRGFFTAGGLSAFIKDSPVGRAGILVSAGGHGIKGKPSAFKDFSAVSVEPPRPVVSINEIFDEERLMAIWSGTAGDWRTNKMSSKSYDQIYWHRALFYGNSEMECLLPEERKKDFRLALSIAKPELSPKGKANNGYVLKLSGNPEKGVVLELIRNSEVVQTSELGKDALPLRLRLRQAGPFLIGYTDDKQVLVWKDASALEGSKVAWAAKGIEIDPDSVQIYSRGLLDYSFNRAPVDWRKAGGVWQVTNRWECDPRWSFMAGMPPFLAKARSENLQKVLSKDAKWKIKSLQEHLKMVPDQSSKLAALWHKREFDGDITAECFLGQMMDYRRGGGNYSRYVQNFCITLCGDGKNLDTGYSCVFGGWGNTKSAIVKNGKIVAECNAKIPTHMGIHRMWFRIRARRKGNRILFAAYTSKGRNAGEITILNLEYEDKEPLDGKRLGIWSYNNGIMLARLRVTAEVEGPKESPWEEYPPIAQCIYTMPKEEKKKK